MRARTPVRPGEAAIDSRDDFVKKNRWNGSSAIGFADPAAVSADARIPSLERFGLGSGRAEPRDREIGLFD